MTIAETEQWRKIAEFPHYDVSTFGRVRRNRPDSRGRFGGLIMNLRRRSNCVLVALSDARAVKHTRSVARLVLTTFVGPDSQKDARHLDGDPQNCFLSNLAWSDRTEIVAGMIDRGTMVKGDAHWTRKRPEALSTGDEHWTRQKPEAVPRGERVARAKLTEKDVRFIRASSLPTAELSKMFGVNTANIRHIKRGLTWAHVQ